MNPTEKRCDVCGKKFMGKGRQKYCSPECELNRRRMFYPSKSRRPKTVKPNKESEIARINREARKMGLSYGYYVAQYGGGANVRGKKVSATGQTL